MFRSKRSNHSLLETLENRRLLSADLVVKPNVTYAATTGVSGYTPAQIAHAYGFDQISFGAVKGDGSGQTIAIVDAFNDPNIKNDLTTFDNQFGLAAANLKVVSQTGSTTSLPKTDAGWSGEIALDVEWAHAMAPGANILLVEAKSDSMSDLISAVDYARNASGVSTVSMSWGSSEFNGEASYDTHFMTPAGHQGVTFVSASGDEGAGFGAEWPSSSPYVLSVGGTTLLTDSSGNYSSESVWSGSTGGNSQYESEPSYQTGAQTSGKRSTPDVAYDADPNTGFAVYNTADGGWEVVGGTSAGSPQWAALIAIANQGRSINGQSSLDGYSGTLPALYSLYASPTSASYSQYIADFNDITASSGGGFGGSGFGGGGYGGGGYGGWGRGGWGRHRWGRFGRFATTTSPTTTATAGNGYDTTTGLGTPKANAVVTALVSKNNSPSSSTTTTTKKTSKSATSKLKKYHAFHSDVVLTSSMPIVTGTFVVGTTLNGKDIYSVVPVTD